MNKLIACSLLALGVASVTPALAQGVYVGPNGVGVDTGVRHYRDYDGDRGDRYRDGGYYEGRSSYDGYRRHHRDDD
jgi:hypothetical protein